MRDPARPSPNGDNEIVKFDGMTWIVTIEHKTETNGRTSPCSGPLESGWEM